MIEEKFNGAIITADGEISDDNHTPPEPTPEEVLEAKIAEITRKLDTQSSILMQIGMATTPPPDIPDTPADPKDLPMSTGPQPDAETLKNLMGGMTPPEIP
ncbi:hypothetical protein [Peptococcus simiae]|uniref:hypothetical protein n=1 Tax=Peptococcus simiae TaxID=1643805 RepID=UPI00398065E5